MYRGWCVGDGVYAQDHHVSQVVPLPPCALPPVCNFPSCKRKRGNMLTGSGPQVSDVLQPEGKQNPLQRLHRRHGQDRRGRQVPPAKAADGIHRHGVKHTPSTPNPHTQTAEPRTPKPLTPPLSNVSHIVPSFHGVFCIPTASGVAIHSPQFAEAAAADEAHLAAIKCAKGMAMLAMRVLVDGGVADGARRDFEKAD